MLDDPPLIVSILGTRGLTFGSNVILQSHRGQFCAGGLVVCVQNTPNAQTFRDFHKEGRVFDIHDLPYRHLSNVQSQPEDLDVWLSGVNIARRNECIYKPRVSGGLDTSTNNP